MRKNIFLSAIFFLLAVLTLATNGQAQVDSHQTHWILNVQGANGEALEIVTPKSDLKAREDASPNALMRVFNDNSNRNNNSSAFGDFIRNARDSVVYGVSHTVRHLPLEAASFYSAIGALAVYDCAIAVKSNPMACSEFGQTLQDPISHFSFFVFMSTNHSVSHFLNTGGRYFIPKAAIGYVGMAAGSFVSSIAVEFLTDTDIQYIRKNFFKGNKTDIDRDRLDQAYRNAYYKFVQDPLGVSRHTPHLISLTLAAFLSSVTQSIFSFANNNILSRTENLTNRLYRAPIDVIKRNGIYRPKRVTKKRIFLPLLKLVVKTGKWLTFTHNPIMGFAFRVGHIVIFFAWNDILHPPIQRAWDLRKYFEKMNDEKISILEHLVAGYTEQPTLQQLNNVSYAGFFTNIFSFFFNLPSSSQRDGIRERNHVQDNLKALLNMPSDQASLQYTDVDNQHFPETLLDVPDLTEEIETDLFVGETTKARGDVLLEKVLRFNVHVQDYRDTLLREFDEAKHRWESFFQSAIAWQNTTYNFYRHIIQTQEQLSFETEPRTPIHIRPPHLSNDPTASAYYYQDFFPDQNTKSKGMLDALHFSSRPLNESNDIFTQRLLDESKVLRFGVQPNIVHQLSNPDLQWLYDRLSNEHTFVTGQPTENHLSLVSLLNKGFDISQMYDFEDMDFQVRSEVLFDPVLKLNPDILYTKTTQEINEFTEFLKGQPEGIASYYNHLANQGWDWDQLYAFNTEDITVRYNALNIGLNGELLKTRNTQDIHRFVNFLRDQPEDRTSYCTLLANQEWDWDRLLRLTPDNIDLLMRASRLGLHPEFLKTNDVQEISGFIQLLESLPSYVIQAYYVNIANQPWTHNNSQTAEEGSLLLEDFINQKGISIVQNGAMYFDPSDKQGSKHYGIIYYSTVEKLLISMVCGESIKEVNLVQRSAFGLGDLEFNAPRIWENKPALCDQIETVHHAFFVKENGQDIYYYNLLDYVSKNIGDQITLENFETFWRNQVISTVEPVLSQYIERRTHVLGEDISHVYNNTNYLINYSHYSDNFHLTGGVVQDQDMGTASKGIHQFERDMTEYHLNLLIALLPKQDSFLSPFRNYINCIRQLSEYPGYRFEEIIHASASCQGEDSTWADQIESAFQIHNVIETLNDNPIIISMVHARMLENILRDMYVYIQERLPNNQNTIILLRVVNVILGTIQKSILHSSEIDIRINALTST